MSMEEGSFTKKLLGILEATHFEGADVFSRPDRINKIKVYESYEFMQPFIKWFTENITEENCVTKEQLMKYNELKKSGELVPVMDLDTVIGTFCNETSSTMLTTELEPAIAAAKKELEALEALENFLKEHEKNEEKKVSNFSIKDLDDAISTELEELEELNSQFNDCLEKYSTTWQDLRSCYSHQHTPGIHKFEESQNSDNLLAKINEMGKQISENISHSLTNDFKQVLPQQGALDVKPYEYWLVFKRLEEVHKELISTLSKQEAISLYNNCLQHLVNNIHNVNDFEEIRCFLNDSSYRSRIECSLNDILKEEIDCLSSFQLEDAQRANTYLTDRLDRLTKIEFILREKQLCSNALYLAMERNALISDFQLQKLQESLDFIESYSKKFEERMNFMSNYKPKNEEVINQYHQEMMKILNVKDNSLTTLDAEISEFNTKINAVNESLYRELELLQSNILNRLNGNKEKNQILFDGPTIEAFNHVFTNFIDLLEPKLKSLTSTKTKTNKISKMFEEIGGEGQALVKKDCIWLKCLNDPDFYVQVEEMEAKLQSMKKY